MLYTIKNEYLALTVDPLGAQMMSLKSRDGLEYLWQGDPAYWADRAPVLFPLIGRLEKAQYRVQGVPYTMGIHGFAAHSEFSPGSQTGDSITLRLSESPETLAQYPFAFTLEITYRLVGNGLRVENRVTNTGSVTMPFALGGHPGFRVPLEPGEAFEDYYLEFSAACQPDRMGFTEDTILLNGQNVTYPLKNERYLPLRHDLFDEDAVILQHMAREVTLKSSRHSITVAYPDMPYLGIWHMPKTDAPYVCIEPWTSLPGRSGMAEEFSCRSDFIHLPPQAAWESIWSITLD